MIFRHEHLVLITLRKLDPQKDKYHATKERYIPSAVEEKQACHCGAEVAAPGSKCDFCSASVHQQVELSIKAGQVVAELQQVVAPSAGSMLHRRQKKKKK